jgi:hypothetical protein
LTVVSTWKPNSSGTSAEKRTDTSLTGCSVTHAHRQLLANATIRPLRNHAATWPFGSPYMGLIVHGNSILRGAACSNHSPCHSGPETSHDAPIVAALRKPFPDLDEKDEIRVFDDRQLPSRRGRSPYTVAFFYKELEYGLRFVAEPDKAPQLPDIRCCRSRRWRPARF